MGVAGAVPITAVKLPVAGFRRQAAGSNAAGLMRKAAIPADSRRAGCTGNDGRAKVSGIACPPLEKRPADASGRAHGPTSGRDTTACFAGGE